MTYRPIIGLDLSLTKTGITISHRGDHPGLFTGKRLSKLVRSNPGDSFPWAATTLERSPTNADPARMIHIRKEVMDLVLTVTQIFGNRPLVVIEGFSFASKGRAVLQIGGLGWMVRAGLYETVPYIEIPPTVLKKFATGKGNATKQQVMAETTKRAGIHFDDPDITDSFVLWCIGLHLQGQGHRSPLLDMPTENIESLNGIELRGAR